MPERVEAGRYDLDRGLSRLAAEAGPGEALIARVLADAAMVTAERRPAPAAAPPGRARRSGVLSALFGNWSRPAVAGAVATLLLSLGVGLGIGYMQDDEVMIAAGAVASLSPLDNMEQEVIAVVDEDFFGLDAPL